MRARLAELGDRFSTTVPWRRRGILFFAGAIATLALPPVGFWPAIFPAFWILCRMADADAARSRKASFGTGWWFALGYFTVGWYWIANAPLVFSDRLWWMVPFAAFGLPAVMAIYYGLAALAARPIGSGLPRALALAGLFVAADWLRGHLFTGFPWNVWGYAWAEDHFLSQGASLMGVYALGIPVLASAALVVGSLERKGRSAALLLLLAALIPASIAAYGAWRLSAAPEVSLHEGNAPGLRIVQAGIPQREKWARQYARRNFDRHLTLSREDRPGWVNHVIWPETAAAFFIEKAPDARREIAAMLPEDGFLLTGAPRRRADPPALHNSLVAITDSGDVAATYDKHHLVPFGEYVPLKSLLPIDKVTAGATDYAPGPGPRSVTVGDLPPVSPLICYEVIFPAAVTDEERRPGWMLNLTNDAWYGETAGPYQHLQHARLRAIEQGLPLVRAANTGISAVFDAYGRELGRVGLNEAGVIDFHLPAAIAPPAFARIGSFALPSLLLCLFGFAVMAHCRCKNIGPFRLFVERDS